MKEKDIGSMQHTTWRCQYYVVYLCQGSPGPAEICESIISLQYVFVHICSTYKVYGKGYRKFTLPMTSLRFLNKKQVIEGS